MTNSIETNVASALETWLKDEIIMADTGRNAYLSDFDERKADFDKPFDDPANVNAQKVLSHHNRLRLWASQYSEFGLQTNDQATARLLFCSLMRISGSFREQCLLVSNTPDQYASKRQSSEPCGVDLKKVVQREFANPVTLHPDPATRMSKLLERTNTTNDMNLAVHERMHTMNVPTIGGTTIGVEAVVMTQSMWAGLAVAQIMVAASFRGGDYAQVPFFEPKSITDQSALQYPLAST